MVSPELAQVSAEQAGLYLVSVETDAVPSSASVQESFDPDDSVSRWAELGNLAGRALRLRTPGVIQSTRRSNGVFSSQDPHGYRIDPARPDEHSVFERLTEDNYERD